MLIGVSDGKPTQERLDDIHDMIHIIVKVTMIHPSSTFETDQCDFSKGV